MRSAAAAIAWEFRRRHRWGLIVLGAYFLVLAAIKLFAPTSVTFENEESFALVVVVPITSMFLYFLAVFSFGLSGDLAARQSMYPARMFTLPVSTGALAGWPMLYGSLAMIVLWLGTRFLNVWPADANVPVIWPLLLGPSLLAWTQALTWMPYPLPGLRVIVSVLWLTAIDAVVLVALQFKTPEPVMVALLAPHVPLAYLVARFAVGRARRGEVPDWLRVFARRETKARGRPPFSSPARAQAWFEWRRHGGSLPFFVAILLPCELSLLFVFRETPSIVFEVLTVVLLTPPFMAAFEAASVSKSNPGSDSYGVSPFTATRPLSNASLIAAKLKATVWSTLAAWVLVAVAVPLAVRLSGTAPIVIDWAHNLVKVMGTPRAIAIALLGLTAFVASTWKQLVQSLYVGMSGREWAVKASVFVALAVIAVAVPICHWIVQSKAAIAVLWESLPTIAAVLVCVKLAAAGWIAVRLHDRRLLSDRALLLGAICWDVAVFAVYGLLVWIVPGMIIRHYFLALIAILMVPLARLSAAPLALAANRHR